METVKRIEIKSHSVALVSYEKTKVWAVEITESDYPGQNPVCEITFTVEDDARRCWEAIAVARYIN